MRYTIVYRVEDTGREFLLSLSRPSDRHPARLSFAGDPIVCKTPEEAWAKKEQAMRNGVDFRHPGTFELREIA